MMIGIKCVVFVVVLTFLQSPARGDVQVSCVFMQSCMLPCSFQANAGLLIHWMKAENTPVHSYYRNQDQLAHQGQRYKGRTSMFKDEISGGNASLLLTRVEIQDQGRYKCYTSIKDGDEGSSYVDLKVDAPVRKVDMQQVENRITCSSEGIYPEPELTWSTSPPSNVTSENPTRVQNQQQLYSISGSLIPSDGDTDLVYSCTVSSGRNKRRATLFKQTSITGSDAETTIPCTSSNTPLTSLVWRFNHSQIILNQTGSDYTVSEGWRQHVKGVSESGSLTLKDLSSSQEGIYTCELSNDEETNIKNTFLRMETSPHYVVITCLLVGAVAVVLVITMMPVLDCKECKGKTDVKTWRRELQQMMQVDYVNGATPCLKKEPQTKYQTSLSLCSLVKWKRWSCCSALKCDCIKLMSANLPWRHQCKNVEEVEL